MAGSAGEVGPAFHSRVQVGERDGVANVDLTVIDIDIDIDIGGYGDVKQVPGAAQCIRAMVIKKCDGCDHDFSLPVKNSLNEFRSLRSAFSGLHGLSD